MKYFKIYFHNNEYPSILNHEGLLEVILRHFQSDMISALAYNSEEATDLLEAYRLALQELPSLLLISIFKSYNINIREVLVFNDDIDNINENNQNIIDK